jgi:hypothetical protein
MAPCTPEIRRLFEGTCCFHLCHLFHTGYLAGLGFYLKVEAECFPKHQSPSARPYSVTSWKIAASIGSCLQRHRDHFLSCKTSPSRSSMLVPSATCLHHRRWRYSLSSAGAGALCRTNPLVSGLQWGLSQFLADVQIAANVSACHVTFWPQSRTCIRVVKSIVSRLLVRWIGKWRPFVKWEEWLSAKKNLALSCLNNVHLPA